MSLESTIRMMTESKVVKEDGHTDVASAKRQCKTAMEDAQAIIGVLDGMNDEDALPTWWTNKLAIAANSMNKLNDYLSNPTEQKEEVTEEVEMTDINEGRMKELHGYMEKGMSAKEIAKKMKLDVKTIKALIGEEVEIEEEFIDDLIEAVELDEAPKMKYALVGKDMKIYSMGSDERDLRLDRRSLEKRFKDVAPLKMARLKTAQTIGDKVDKSQLKEETVNEHTHYKMEPFGVSRSLVDSVKAVLAGKPSRENIPEEILDDDVADFIGAASKAAAAGKKKFKFGDKEYPVTIKKSTADKVSKKMEESVKKEEEGEEDAPSDDKKAKEKKDEKNGKKEPIEIDPEIKEEAEGEMTDAQMKKREEIVKSMKKREQEFKDKYGDRWKEVMYATATKMAMKEAKK